MTELDTVARHQLPVVAVVRNDAGWTQILRKQEVVLGDDVACRLAYTDYQVIAEGCGAKGLKVDAIERVDSVLSEALATSRAAHG